MYQAQLSALISFFQETILQKKWWRFFFSQELDFPRLDVLFRDSSLRAVSMGHPGNSIRLYHSPSSSLLWWKHCAKRFKYSHYIHNLNKKFDIITAMITFLFPFLKVEAKLGACLPSFLPGGKLCGRVINTLMDPAGTVSCNLICKEIIWVIDGDKQFLLDRGTLCLAPQMTFKSLLQQEKKGWCQDKWNHISSLKQAFNCLSWSLL